MFENETDQIISDLGCAIDYLGDAYTSLEYDDETLQNLNPYEKSLLDSILGLIDDAKGVCQSLNNCLYRKQRSV